jgi:hypothetical protein
MLIRNKGVKLEKLKFNKCVIHPCVCVSLHNYSHMIPEELLPSHSRLCVQHTAVKEVAGPCRLGASCDVLS